MRQGNYTHQRNVGWGLGELHDTSTRCAHITQIGHPCNRPRSPIVATHGCTWSPINAHVMDANTLCHGRPRPASHGHPHASHVTAHHGHIWASTSHFTWGHAIARMESHALPYTPTRDGLWTSILVHFVDSHVHGWTSTKFWAFTSSVGCPRNLVVAHDNTWTPRKSRGCPQAAPFTSSLAHLHPRCQSTHVQYTSTSVHVSRPSASMSVSTFVRVLRPALSTMLVHVSPHATTTHVHIRPASAHVCPSATTIGDHSRPMLTHVYPRCQPICAHDTSSR